MKIWRHLNGNKREGKEIMSRPPLYFKRGMRAYIEVEIRTYGEEQARTRLANKVGKAPLVFSKNIGGHRYPLPLAEQLEAFSRTFDDVARVAFTEKGSKPSETTPKQFKAPMTPKVPREVPKPQETAQTPPRAAEDNSLPEPYRTMMRRVKGLREFVKSHNNFDHLNSMRLALDMTAALKVGLPLEGLLYSATLSWQKDSREQARVSEFNHATWKHADEGTHGVSPWVEKLVEAGLLVWLGGPAGTGKSTAARWTAERLGMRYGEINLAGALPSALKGKDRLKEFVESVFPDFYSKGGLLCIEEIDCAHPTVIPVINNAIANGEFHNDADGKVYARHPDFRLVATGNTWGTGATAEYNARNKLDGATLDRFRVGRVNTDHDERLEMYLVRKAVGV